MKRDEYKDLPKGYYHLSTDGRWGGIIFHTPELFAYGMVLMGLVTLQFPIEIYAFTLMDNHIHIVLSGTGSTCRELFHYLVRKLNTKLRTAGYPELPEDYGFKLVPIDSREQFVSEIIYGDRNPLEKQLCVPAGYPWGTTLIHHSFITSLFKWTKVGDMSKRELERITGSRVPIPAHWELNPVLGLNPSGFVRNDKFLQRVPTPKSYLSRLVKDYEAAVQVADRLGEDVSFSCEEEEGILNELLRKHFSGKYVRHLDNNEKGRLAVMLSQNYHLPTARIAVLLGLQEYLVKQFLNAKDYGKR
ncbi:MAG: hypothetical protein J6P56_10485 [Bacteroidales bacterium]|jgi:REP element-mobilizing transposase RayT|nr:hypothetical protein [Bacteroidales bacterium]